MIWYIGSVDEPMIARCEVVGLANIVIIRGVLDGHVMLLELMSDEGRSLYGSALLANI